MWGGEQIAHSHEFGPEGPATCPEFSDLLVRAREKQADHMSDQILEISDDSTNDWVDRETAAGRIVRVLDHEHVQRSRLRVDERFRLMEKLAPEKYGVKQQIVVTRDEERARLDTLSPEQRMAEAEDLIEQARRRIASGNVTDVPASDDEEQGGDRQQVTLHRWHAEHVLEDLDRFALLPAATEAVGLARKRAFGCAA
jgi:hypothetical protein